MGSSSLVTDSGGAIVQQLDYLPYGEERVAVKAANTSDLAKKYTGKELDEETGLYYYGARYYDSRIARFVSVDPVARDVSMQKLFTQPQAWNTYAYTINNPVKYVDPDGRTFLEKIGGIAEGVGNGISSTIVGLFDAASHPFDTYTAVEKGAANVVINTLDDAKTTYNYVQNNSLSDFSNDVKKNAKAKIDELQKFSDQYQAMSDHDKGVLIGKVSERAGELALSIKGIFTEPTIAIGVKTPTNMVGAVNKIDKFFNSAPKNARDFIIQRYGQYAKGSYEIPGYSGGASRATYTKAVNSLGQTIKMYKDSYDKFGNFSHRKIKFPN